jgi:glycosyltransferase involved in cell wall biosynthesis
VLPYIGDWAAELVTLWATDPPDVVHAYGWVGGLAAQLAARWQHLPVVQTFHGLAATLAPGPGTGDTERARLEPLLARNATWVTGGSSAEADELARMRHTRAGLSILATGVDIERFAPVGPRPTDTDHHRVLCLEPNPLRVNGFDRPIRVLPKLSGTELVVAETAATNSRNDKERRGLKKLAAELGVRDRIRFLGRVADDELPALVRSADVVACTPRQSPRATTALQAMASGVVVVATGVGALADTVINSVTGRVVSPTDPNELVAALKGFQTQGFQRASMGAAGRSRAASRYTWDRIALDALNIYRQAISQHVPHSTSTATRGHPTRGRRRMAVR